MCQLQIPDIKPPPSVPTEKYVKILLVVEAADDVIHGE